MLNGAGRPTLSIGVLALLGGFDEHISMLHRLEDPSLRITAVRTVRDLRVLDGIILPGGESTALRLLLHSSGLGEALRQHIRLGLPVWGTCAGLILLAKELEEPDMPYIASLGIRVERNTYGSQLDSFSAPVRISCISGDPFEAVFIRAPGIIRTDPGVEVLAEYRGRPVACCEESIIATTFHPELTEDSRFHRYFVHFVRSRSMLPTVSLNSDIAESR